MSNVDPTPHEPTSPGGPTLLDEWRTRLGDLEGLCPWPGPRPLSIAKDRTKPWRFVGRAEEIRRFMNDLADHSLLVLHGTSGAGKSSLLNVGLVSVMVQNQYRPFVCNRWNTAGADVEQHIVAELRRQRLLPPAVVRRIQSGTGLAEALDDEFGSRAVLVLDQFEELIRYQREGFLDIARWLLDVHQRRSIKIVLSLRSEYVFELADLIKAARPFATDYVELATMTAPEDIERIVGGPNRDGEDRIDKGAADTVVGRWLDLAPSAPQRTLLYLHAALYAMFWNARDEHRATVTADDVRMLDERAGEMPPTGAEDARGFFDAGFDLTIERKLSLCRQACLPAVPESGGTPGDGHGMLARGVLVSSTLEQVYEAVPHLSSGGYKVEQELPDLFLLTSARELQLLTRRFDEPGSSGVLGTDDAKLLVRRLTLAGVADGGRGGRATDLDLLAASPPDLLDYASIGTPPASPAGKRSTVLAKLGVSPVPWDVDPDDVTAGVLQGVPPWLSLVEHARAFAFAVHWLTESSIIRVSAPQGTAMASLIHDGFGVALKNWAQRRGRDARAAVRALTAFEGERWTWRGSNAFSGTHEAPRLLVNLRWRGCEISSADFRHVTLVNCDLRASRFIGCTFEGATFVNCLLDGASFDWCTIVGPSPANDDRQPPYWAEGKKARLPEFVLPIGEELAGDFAAFRGTPADATELYSPTSGVPAIPARRLSEPGGVIDPDAVMSVPTDNRGLAVYGGHLSSLMIRGCIFGSDGSITLAHIAGASLNVVEQDTFRLTLTWCVVRGLNVSTRAGATEPAGGLEITADNCRLAETWFGPVLKGHVDIDDTSAYAVTNLSPDTLKVKLTSSAYGAVLNVDTSDENNGPMRFDTPRAGREALEELVAGAQQMAFRSRPAQVELELRADEYLAERSAT